MQGRTPVFIVTSPRPRVGKTLIARAMTEYFGAQRRPVTAFDVNPDAFKLIDYLPAYTAAASINDTRGEVALFDQLVQPDEVVKIVDLEHALFDRFFAVLAQIDLLAEAQRNSVAPMVLFVAEPDERARQGYAMLRDRLKNLPVVPVFNEYVPQIAQHRAHFPPTPRGGEPVVIPALTPVLRGVVDRPGFSFISYVAKTRDTTTELYDWVRRVFVVFRELEVRLLLRDLQSPRRRRYA